MQIFSRFYTNITDRNSPHNISIDVMVIPDSIPLENVVTNFDLTFCQVWWNGEKIISHNVDDIRNKSGSLNRDYVESYLDMNTFIINRIKKYKNRGFKISISFDHLNLSERMIESKGKSIESCGEHWAVSSIYSYVKDIFPPRFRDILELGVYPKDMTCKSLLEMFEGKEEVAKAFILGFYNEKRHFLRGKYREAFENVFYDIIPCFKTYNHQESFSLIENWILEKSEEIAVFYDSWKDERMALRDMYQQIYR